MFHDVIIGIPKEIMKGENRVAASPDTVKKMVAGGARVLVETMAGVGSFFSDDDFKAAGASIETNVESLYEQAHIILKVKEPLFHEGLNKHEVNLFHPGQYLITFLHPASPVNHEMIKNLAMMDVTSFTLDGIPRISRAQNMDALTSMSTVAGYKSVLMAANRLSKFVPMIGSAVGVIKPAQVVVVGAGVCGLQAIATAKRLGAVVTAVDIRPDACEQAKSLGSNVWDVGVPAEVAIGQGGYAQRLPDEWLNKERENLKEAVKKADILILCALIPGKQAPLLVTEDMVKSMANGSSIVDVAIDQGGNCACTVPGKVENVHGVTIDGTKNIPGMVPTSSTWMFAQNIYNFIAYVVKDGKIELNREDEIIASSLTTYKKEIVHAGAREAMNL
ncbi:NAD/NADP transhydrogenase alpha subunit [Desulfitobacterium dichloroeliminans LMG P-21439]|uniref:proton-translocating NAD(P)(+) transhydrogenase n=1 Tax=Desulfitobacterium dichloroeliminans (strain LMG P-21439 / DCA1) TaxID=871963 RepID=L0F427_DESDL|nr:NAD(P) transhydrogenase subunit alpha [Desulfitobacterium dichloroeliminans]AGA67815.1 NAD/NADP transhydrogenase alpha subunit [Desulfitobacterium dichloroeliminans LMG P-21439]